ncbi:hypothetical protein AwWohl_01100 [Gammaproteobacteria bacterium]|nr:hypothetical protein AwWohl_01100 [Gammaproteobacteria bacterium]
MQKYSQVSPAITLFNVDQMQGHEFEYFVAQLLRKQGFRSVKVTSGSSDFGVDILATKYFTKWAIQCKRYTSNLSRTAISDAVAGKAHYGCAKAMVVTNSYFSKQALVFSKTTNCTLIDRDALDIWMGGSLPIKSSFVFRKIFFLILFITSCACLFYGFLLWLSFYQ